MTTLKHFIAALKSLFDARLIVMLIPALMFLFTDRPVLFSLTYAVAIVVALVAVAHSLRMLIFPYVSLRTAVETATTQPLPAAILYASTLAFMLFLVQTMVAWIQAAGHAA
jgi:hypothetical protein